MSTSYKANGEAVREYYRRQGEQRERERIAKLLKEHLGNGDKTWSPVYVIKLIEDKNNASL
jgi:hypothetical protein